MSLLSDIAVSLQRGEDEQVALLVRQALDEFEAQAPAEEVTPS